MKKHIKLIGSFVFMLCMAVGVIYAVMETKANDTETGIYYQQGVAYTEATVKTAPANPEGYDDYLFAGWYENKGTEAAPEYEPVKTPAVGTPYCAKWVPAAVLGIKAQVSETILNDDTDTTSKNMIRFVTSIDSTNYKRIAFKLTVDSCDLIDTGLLAEDGTDEYVYTTIYGVGAKEDDENVEATKYEYTPAQVFNNNASTYFKTYTFTDVPDTYFNLDITVTPYWVTYDGTEVEGTTSIRSANYCRGWRYVETHEEGSTVASAGTYTSPFATLKEAVNDIPTDLADYNITPQVILKSDIILSCGLTINKTLNLRSESTDVIRSIKPGTKMRMITVNATGGEVSLENVKIDGDSKGGSVTLTKGDFTMKSGSTITSGVEYLGANVLLEGTAGTFTMEANSIISNGSSENKGSNVHIKDGDGIFVMKEGSIISGGTTTTMGGNIYIAGGTVNMLGGTISGGTAENGGNVYIAEGTMNMHAGTVEKGWAMGNEDVNTGGGNIYCLGKLTMNGGTIQDGIAGSSATTVRGGNVLVTKTDTVTGEFYLNGGNVINGKATQRGGNIHVNHAKLELGTGVITVTGGKIVTITNDTGATPTMNEKVSAAYQNLSMYGDTAKNKIAISGTMNLSSRIGISVSSSHEITDTVDTSVTKKFNNLGNFATGATESEKTYQEIFISDVDGLQATLSSGTLSMNISNATTYYTADDYIKDESLFVPAWQGEWTPPTELLDFEEKWESLKDPDGRLMSMAHRGENKIYYPENSIEGMMSCMKAGVDFVELDVRFTKDGEMVLMHDATLTRTTNVIALRDSGVTGLPESNNVEDWTLEELRKLRLVRGANITNYVIPTLEDAIKICNGNIFVYLDIKTTNRQTTWADNIYPLVKQHKAYRSIWLPPFYAGSSELSTWVERIKTDSGSEEVAFLASVSADNLSKVMSNIQVSGLLTVLRTSDYLSDFDTTYADYLKKGYRISTNAFETQTPNLTLEDWKELYAKGYNVLHVDNYMTLLNYIAETAYPSIKYDPNKFPSGDSGKFPG